MDLRTAGGCWLDIFPQPAMAGSARRLLGPGEFTGLRVPGIGWGLVIASLRAGPAAHVELFAEHHAVAAIRLSPGQEVDDVAAMAHGAAIDSVRLSEVPPPARGAASMLS